MNSAPEQLLKHELIALLREREISLVQKQEKTDHFQFKVAQLQRMLFGHKRKRTRTSSPHLPLPYETSQHQLSQQQEEIIGKIEYVRKKQKASAHKGPIALPAHLPVEEVGIYPEGVLPQMQRSGKQIAEESECISANFFICRYIRYKYAPKNKEGAPGNFQKRLIGMDGPGPRLLAPTLVDKIHLPLLRQRQLFLNSQSIF